MEFVSVYDVEAQALYTMPAAELAPGMVQISLQRADGSEAIVWVEAAKLELNDYQHPPFPETVRAYFRLLAQTFADVHPLTVEAWEDIFRRDEHWEQELLIWLRLAALYEAFLKSAPRTQAEKQDAFRLLLTSSTCPQDKVLALAEIEVLSQAEAKSLVDAYFAPE